MRMGLLAENVGESGRAFLEAFAVVVVVLSMGIGLFAPPFGAGYYTACAIGKVKPETGMRPIVGYLLALLAGLIIVAAVPWISTGFPKR